MTSSYDVSIKERITVKGDKLAVLQAELFFVLSTVFFFLSQIDD